MKAEILKHTGLTAEQFYDLYKTPEAFWKSKSGKAFQAKYGALLKKSQGGVNLDVNNNGIPDYREVLDNQQTIKTPTTGVGFGQVGKVPNPYPDAPEGSPITGFKFGPQANQFKSQPIPKSVGYQQTDPFAKAKPFATDTISKLSKKNMPLPEGIDEPLPKDIGSDTDLGAKGSGFDLEKAAQYIKPVTNIIEGGKLWEEQKKAREKAESDLATLKVVGESIKSQDRDTQRIMAETAARKRKALMPVQTGFETYPIMGVGTNPLGQTSKSGGKMIRYPHGGEITNTYVPPVDLYTQLGYEPLDESNFKPLTKPELKAYRTGGKLPKAYWGMTGGMGVPVETASPYETADEMQARLDAEEEKKKESRNQLLSAVTSASAVAQGSQGPEAGALIGEGIGEGLGTAIGGKWGGVLGGELGKLAGGLVDTSGEHMASTNKQYSKELGIITGTLARKQNPSFSAYTEHGGSINPQFITHFNDIPMSNIMKKDPMMNTLRTGGSIKTNQVGNIKTLSGGHLEPMGYNRYSDGSGIISMIKGQTHDESNGQHTGVLMNYSKAAGGMNVQADVEAQDKEPVAEVATDLSKPNDVSAMVFGDMLVNERTVGNHPLLKNHFGKTFQKLMEDVGEATKKINVEQEKNTQKINASDDRTPIGRLALGTLTVNEQAYNKKLAILDNTVKIAAVSQDIFKTAADGLKVDARKLSEGKLVPAKKEFINSKHGGKVSKAQQGFTHQPVKEGNLPWSDIGQFANEDWATQEGYSGKWTPKVYGAFADNARFTKILNILMNYQGEGADALRGQMSKYKNPEELRTFLVTQSTNKLIGPIHNMVDDAIKQTEDTTPTTTPAPVPAEGDENYEVAKYQRTGWETIAGQILPWTRKQPGEALLGDQLSGELFALSNNEVEPVQARFYHPQLDVPYDISLQDQLNENQADFNALALKVGDNPAALSALAGQKYAANSKVLAEQFRMNQAKKDQVYAQNRATLNDAQLKNLTIADQQYVRQAQAKSATKAVTQEALSSIASKIGQNRLENRTLQTYANMFPDYSFDKSYRIRHTGAPVDWNIDQGVYSPDEGPITDVPVYNDKGVVIKYKQIRKPEAAKKKEETVTPPPAATPSYVASKDIAQQRYGGLVKAFKNI